jgi:hypothetical protein
LRKEKCEKEEKKKAGSGQFKRNDSCGRGGKMKVNIVK